jgi:hypothetical protein
MCIADMVAIQQREGDCAAVGFQALKAISEKFSEYWTPELFVDGVLKGHKLWQQQKQKQKDADQDADPGQSRLAAPVKVDSFSRVFELRRPNKIFVQRTAKYAVEQICKGGEGDRTQRAERTSALGFLATVVTALPFPDWECVQVLVQVALDAGVKLGSHALSALNTLCDGEHTERAAAMDDAARAFILFEICRFLLANYSHRSGFPPEARTPPPLCLPDDLLPCRTDDEQQSRLLMPQGTGIGFYDPPDRDVAQGFVRGRMLQAAGIGAQ